MNMLSREAAPVFNAGLSALAATAAAFFVYAMPGNLFAGLVEATGVSSLISAARPPLGLTARLGAMAVAGAVIFLLVWAVLRRIDGAAVAAEDEVEPDVAAILPRLRRADAHPDAPARRPLLARQDLGEPAEAPLPAKPAEQLEAPQEAESCETIPSFFATDEDLPDQEPVPAAQEPHAEPTSATEAAPEDAAPAQHLTEPRAEEAPARAPGDEAVLPDRDALMARLPLPEDRGESVSGLFQRLDAGLANLEWPLPPGGQEAQEEQSEPKDHVGDQLRNALDDLRKMAGRAS